MPFKPLFSYFLSNYAYFVSIVTKSAADQRSLLEGLVLTKGRVQSTVTAAINNVLTGLMGFSAPSTFKLASKSTCPSTKKTCNLVVQSSNYIISSIKVKFTSNETAVVSCLMSGQWQQTNPQCQYQQTCMFVVPTTTRILCPIAHCQLGPALVSPTAMTPAERSRRRPSKALCHTTRSSPKLWSEPALTMSLVGLLRAVVLSAE